MNTKAIIVETFQDNNNWEWWGVFINGDEVTAMKETYDDIGGENSPNLIIEGNMFYLGEDIRAYEIDLIDLKK